jgi:hypothetical protein
LSAPTVVTVTPTQYTVVARPITHRVVVSVGSVFIDTISAMAFADFPDAADYPRRLIYNTDDDAVYISNGTTWSAIGSRISVGDPSSGLDLTDDVLTLALATTLTAGALSAADKAKLNNLSGSNSGDLTIDTQGQQNGLSLLAQILTIALAGLGQSGVIADGGAQALSPSFTFLGSLQKFGNPSAAWTLANALVALGSATPNLVIETTGIAGGGDANAATGSLVWSTNLTSPLWIMGARAAGNAAIDVKEFRLLADQNTRMIDVRVPSGLGGQPKFYFGSWGGSAAGDGIFNFINSPTSSVPGVVIKNGASALGDFLQVWNASNQVLARLDVSGNHDLASGAAFRWSGTASDATAAKDTGLARDAAGVVRVTDGGAGTGSIKVKNINGLSFDGSAKLACYATMGTL